MHDLDRVQLEMGDVDELGSDDLDELDDFETGWDESESPFGDEEEAELAMELLSVSNDEELEYFLGGLIKKVARSASKIVRSPVLKGVFRVLKPIAKTVLPIAAGAAGTALGGPVGGMLGGQLGSMVSGLFEVDPQGLGDEELEFETARRFVRLAGTTVKKAMASPKNVSPNLAAKQALKSAAMSMSPTATRSIASKTRAGSGLGLGEAKSGRWIRRGRKIIVMGV